jgi:hypothetical protein
MARNLIWDKASSPVDLIALDAPNNIQVASITNPSSMVFQFYRSYGGSGVDWNISSNVSIKRFGLFSNLADGLVMENYKSRLLLSLRTAKFSYAPVTGTAVFTQGSNYITGTNLDVAFAPGGGFRGFIGDGDLYGANYYAVYDVAANGLSARISDFAYATANTAAINVMVYSNLKTYETCRIPVLNTMFDTEVFFNNSIAVSDLTHVPLMLATLEVVDGASLDFYTVTVDTGLNEKPVSFDAILELEATPH